MTFFTNGKDRVLETSVTTGSGALTLAGAVTGFVTGASQYSNGDTDKWYIEAVDADGIPTGAWETGTYTWGTGGTLTIVGSPDASSTGGKISWAAGTKRAGVGITATRMALKADANNVAPDTHAATSKVTPVDADEMPLVDSAASNVLKKLTWANLKATLKTYFDTLYQAAGTYANLTANIFTAAQSGNSITLTDGAIVAVDLSLGNAYKLTLGGNRTLGVPTNPVDSTQGKIDVYHGTPTFYTLAYAWMWGAAGGNMPVLSTSGGPKDMLAYSVDYYSSGAFTTTIATPGVMTKAGHGYISGQKCQLSTTGALPTGLTAATTYFVHVIDTNTFHLCTTLANVGAGTYINTSGSQSGTHTIVCGSVTLAISKATP